MAQYYPDRAERMNTNGRVVIRCTVSAKGQVTDCEVLSETPPDFDFGKQSVAMAKREFRVRPKTVDGTPVEGATFTKTITWKVPAE